MPHHLGPRHRQKFLGGHRRFSELQVPLRGITPKVLIESLRGLERDGIPTPVHICGGTPLWRYPRGSSAH
ncbi:winged helix-turn-helix transcriptional regulator [Frankia sp. CcWB2]